MEGVGLESEKTKAEAQRRAKTSGGKTVCERERQRKGAAGPQGTWRQSTYTRTAALAFPRGLKVVSLQPEHRTVFGIQ